MTDSAKDRITPTERRELRSLVRGQMKVLRAEVAQRKAELDASVGKRLVERYQDEDRRFEDLQKAVDRIKAKADADLAAAMRAFEEGAPSGRWAWSDRTFRAPNLKWNDNGRERLRSALSSGIEAETRRALHAIDRRETDLLKELALDALHTEAARSFIGKFPTATELLPTATLAAIESRFDGARS